MVVTASYSNWQNNAIGANSFNKAIVFEVKRDDKGASIQLIAIVNHLLIQSMNFGKKKLRDYSTLMTCFTQNRDACSESMIWRDWIES
jgi:hypothetical protein